MGCSSLTAEARAKDNAGSHSAGRSGPVPMARERGEAQARALSTKGSGAGTGGRTGAPVRARSRYLRFVI